MLGLHSTQTVVLIVTVALPVVAVIGLLAMVWTGDDDGSFTGIIAGPIIFITLIAAVWGVAWSFGSDHDLDIRDKAVQSRLQASGIEVDGYEDWDKRVRVRRDNCVAVYQIQTDIDWRQNKQAWPLVGGTGRPVSGCVSQELDELFAVR